MAVLNPVADFRHPDGKIVLLDGSVLDCCPADSPSGEAEPSGLRPDTTGVYLRTGGGKGAVLPAGCPALWEELFLREAFFLYEHRKEILSDSRMFLTPLPFRNNLAYSGTSGLSGATLGIYLEWWENCPRAVLREADGRVYALTYFLAGSPLSGSNRCEAVLRDGSTMHVSFPGPFSDLWSIFMSVNTRYSGVKGRYQVSSLEETVAILQGRTRGKQL